jgi:hypothetical protein
MARAAEHGLSVSKPWGESEPYDFVVGHESNFLRVQVKSMTYCRSHSYYCYLHARKGPLYTDKQIDFVAVYIIPKNIWFIFPIDVVLRAKSTLILSPHMEISRNGAYEEAWHLMRGDISPLRSG